MTNVAGRLLALLAGTGMTTGVVLMTPAAAATAVSTVRVSAPSSMELPAGAATPLSITVSNTGPRVLGTIGVLVAGRDGQGIPDIGMDLMDSRGRWTPVPSDSGMGKIGFTAAGLAFQTGESTSGFRVRPAPDSVGRLLRLGVSVWDTAGRQLASTVIQATVTDPPPQVSTTFPAQLRRGGAYREFDIVVRNPSTTGYRDVRAAVSLTGLIGTPQPPSSGYLSSTDVRIDQRTGGRWTRLAVVPGSDPVFTATLVRPGPDVPPGASRRMHLRIRLLDSPATAVLLADYGVLAGPAGNQQYVTGRFRILPRLATGTGADRSADRGADRGAAGGAEPTPTASSGPAGPPSTAPSAAADQLLVATEQPAATPASHARRSAVLLPAVAGGLGLLLSAAGALLIARHRNPAG